MFAILNPDEFQTAFLEWVRAVSSVTGGGVVAIDRRSQADICAERVPRATRSHWGIENGLHGCLDVAFREDESRVHIGHAAENLGRVGHMALNLLKQEKTAKVGIKIKRQRAGWDNVYMLRVLGIRWLYFVRLPWGATGSIYAAVQPEI